MARPSEYNFEICKEICNEVADGKNIKAALKLKKEYPTFKTWCNWKRDNAELLHLYVKSIQDKSESVDYEIDEILAECRKGKIDPSTANVLIQTLKWKAAKYYPKMFGDQSKLTIDGTLDITTEKKNDLSNWSDEDLKTVTDIADKYDKS